MRLDINLASQPYEDARQFWTRWGTALAAVGLFTLLLLTLTAGGWLAARRDRGTVAGLRNKIAQRDAMRSQAEEILNRPENRATRDDSQFLNLLIERKSFSWTRVLEDLEKVMPARVHVVSIQPELDEDNQLTLKMMVSGESRDKAIELARRMEESHRFAQTYIQSEHFDPSSSSVRFNIIAIYVPQALGTPVGASPATNSPDNAPSASAQISKRSNP
jgi:type IV pilus assembly protein PilN